MSHLNFPFISFPTALSLVTRERRSAPLPPATALPEEGGDCARSSLSLLFSKLNTLSDLSGSSQTFHHLDHSPLDTLQWPHLLTAVQQRQLSPGTEPCRELDCAERKGQDQGTRARLKAPAAAAAACPPPLYLPVPPESATAGRAASLARNPGGRWKAGSRQRKQLVLHGTDAAPSPAFLGRARTAPALRCPDTQRRRSRGQRPDGPPVPGRSARERDAAASAGG